VKKTIHIPEYKQLIALLIEARHAAGLLQTDLAKKLRKPQSFVSRVEAIQRRLDVCEFLVYARALGVDPYTLLHTMEEQTQPTKDTSKRRSHKKSSSQ